MTHSPTIDDLNAETVLAELAQCQQPFLIGVRHHSAAMAKVIPQLLDQFAPEIVLIELPPEFSEWIPWLAHPQTQAPVALSGCDFDGRQLSFYPFADFSPELAAIRWAAQNHIPIEAFDQPLGQRMRSQSDRSANAHGLLAALMERTESADSGQLWERLVESPALGSPAENIRRSGLLFGWASRWNDREPAEYDLARESFMRSRIAAHRGKRAAAVIGAYHAAALLPEPLLWHEPSTDEDAAAEPRDSGRSAAKRRNLRFVTSMIPYSFQQLDERSGYPAGIRDPLWHQKILEATTLPECEEAVAYLIVSICRELRRAGHPMNAADGMEVLRLARDLARLRGLQAPGRGELMEALQTCLTRGQLFGLGRAVADAMQVVLVGTCCGAVPSDLPRCGLAPHIESILQQLRMPGPDTLGQEKRLRLDPFRSSLDCARVVVLEQMAVCQIPYAKRADDGSAGDRESLTSVWDVQWQHATGAMIALAGTRGATLRQAAEGTLRSQGMEKPTDEWGEAQLHQLTTAANCGFTELDAGGATRLVPEQFWFRSPSRRTMDWHLIFVVDVSGSMEPSVIYSALTAAIFSALPALSVTFLAFSTEVIDFINHVEDPLAMLMEVQVGGGTFIWKGLMAARERLKVPARTIVLLVTDFEEGGSIGALLGEVQALVDSGAKTLGLAALSDDGKPRYHTGIAAQVAGCGMPVAALSPLELARWVGEQVR